jgi:hypothetical protein
MQFGEGLCVQPEVARLAPLIYLRVVDDTVDLCVSGVELVVVVRETRTCFVAVGAVLPCTNVHV